MPGFQVTDGHYQNDTAPNPSCCSDPAILCTNCAQLVLNMSRNELTNNELVTNDGLVVNPGVLSRVFDEDDFLPLPVLNWQGEPCDDVVCNKDDYGEDCLPLPPSLESVLANEAARAKGKKKPFTKRLMEEEEEQQEELEDKTRRRSKKTQEEIMQEEEERLHKENSRRLNQISTNLDQTDRLELPVLNWEKVESCDDVCNEDKLELPVSTF